MNLSDLPDLTFLDADLDEMLAESTAIVEALLGRTVERADPIMLLIKSFIAIVAQQRLLINELCKQNLLAYATAGNLEHLGALVGIERLPAAFAKTTLEVKLSAARNTSTLIKKGTRVNAGDDVNFATDEDLIFIAGETFKTVSATCVDAGEIGNGYAAGELRNVVDPQPFLQSISNLTATEGGSEIESDDSLRERIHQAPESFSNAGSSGAYEFWAKTASTLISDVYVESPNPGEVDIYVLLKGGVIPDVEMLNLVYDTLNAGNIRPLTDFVRVKAAIKMSYDVDVNYYISRSNATRAAAIQQAVDSAVNDYVNWQKGKLGRDIEPTDLIYRLRAAGVKRCIVNEPLFLAIGDKSVAIANKINVVYKGLEDD